jgi:hypothetical protein
VLYCRQKASSSVTRNQTQVLGAYIPKDFLAGMFGRVGLLQNVIFSPVLHLVDVDRAVPFPVAPRHLQILAGIPAVHGPFDILESVLECCEDAMFWRCLNRAERQERKHLEGSKAAAREQALR